MRDNDHNISRQPLQHSQPAAIKLVSRQALNELIRILRTHFNDGQHELAKALRLINFQIIVAAIVALCWGGLVSSASAGIPKAADLVSVDLLVDCSTLAKDKSFTVGVRYRMKAGWHIYWKNAGDAGMPTTVTIDAPSDFKVGPLLFPTPSVLRAAGDITDYGYEGVVVLMSRIAVPSDWKPSPIKLSVKTNYLVCEKVCVPGLAKLEMMVDSAASDSDARAEIVRWYNRIPATVETNSTVKSQPDGSLLIDVHGPPTALDESMSTFIPGAADSFAVEMKSLARNAVGFTLQLRISPLTGQKVSQDTLECLLTNNSHSPDAAKGISFVVPLRP